ncbi:hypothetical protein PR048_020718 [Dryococelus australis]|uniref:Uncharacterized protein n=1 Tax=Dryococelus australis TaxID=614101 RepID=A0ABQ9H723_9NEOP|nr:hypothetical protein PR048_020718 [Dryococelus australis]
MGLTRGHAWRSLEVMHFAHSRSCVTLTRGHAWCSLEVMHGAHSRSCMTLTRGHAWRSLEVMHGAHSRSCMALTQCNARSIVVVYPTEREHVYLSLDFDKTNSLRMAFDVPPREGTQVKTNAFVRVRPSVHVDRTAFDVPPREGTQVKTNAFVPVRPYLHVDRTAFDVPPREGTQVKTNACVPVRPYVHVDRTDSYGRSSCPRNESTSWLSKGQLEELALRHAKVAATTRQKDGEMAKVLRRRPSGYRAALRLACVMAPLPCWRFQRVWRRRKNVLVRLDGASALRDTSCELGKILATCAISGQARHTSVVQLTCAMFTRLVLLPSFVDNNLYQSVKHSSVSLRETCRRTQRNSLRSESAARLWLDSAAATSLQHSRTSSLSSSMKLCNTSGNNQPIPAKLNDALRANEGNRDMYGAVPERKGGGNEISLRKPADQRHRPVSGSLVAGELLTWSRLWWSCFQETAAATGTLPDSLLSPEHQSQSSTLVCSLSLSLYTFTATLSSIVLRASSRNNLLELYFPTLGPRWCGSQSSCLLQWGTGFESQQYRSDYLMAPIVYTSLQTLDQVSYCKSSDNTSAMSCAIPLRVYHRDRVLSTPARRLGAPWGSKRMVQHSTKLPHSRDVTCQWPVSVGEHLALPVSPRCTDESVRRTDRVAQTGKISTTHAIRATVVIDVFTRVINNRLLEVGLRPCGNHPHLLFVVNVSGSVGIAAMFCDDCFRWSFALIFPHKALESEVHVCSLIPPHTYIAVSLTCSLRRERVPLQRRVTSSCRQSALREASERRVERMSGWSFTDRRRARRETRGERRNKHKGRKGSATASIGAVISAKGRLDFGLDASSRGLEGPVEGWNRFSRGLEQVQSRVGTGSVEGWNRFSRGLEQVQSRVGTGPVEGWNRFSRGLEQVQ